MAGTQGPFGWMGLMSSLLQPIIGPILGRKQAALQMQDFIEMYPELNNVMTTFAPPTGIRAAYNPETEEVTYEAPLITPQAYQAGSLSTGSHTPTATMMNRLRQREAYTSPPEKQGSLLGDLGRLFS